MRQQHPQWWLAAEKQILLLCVNDCSGPWGDTFVPADTTWNHFEHFRRLFEEWGIPLSIYTDALSLFEARSSNDHAEPVIEFKRARHNLPVAHLVAPTP
jgi:hypothetical protein